MDSPTQPPDAKPLFLSPEAVKGAAYVEAPPDPNAVPPTFDEEIPEGHANSSDDGEIPRDVRIRWLEVARLCALGKTNNYIAERLNYSPDHVGRILQKPIVRAEIYRYRSKLFDQDILTAMKDLGPDAIKVVNEMINSNGEKLKDRADTAKWLLEKLTGKAKQEVNHESNTLAAFMEMLRKMQESGTGLNALPPPGGASDSQTIDVTPRQAAEAPPQASKWENWSKNNL